MQRVRNVCANIVHIGGDLPGCFVTTRPLGSPCDSLLGQLHIDRCGISIRPA